MSVRRLGLLRTGPTRRAADLGGTPTPDLSEVSIAPPAAADELAKPLAGRRILIIVENLPVPFDRRVWQEALTLRQAGAAVAVICPAGKDAPAGEEWRDGILIHRHPLPREADGAIGYLVEYGAALIWETWLAWRLFFRHGFDTIQGCNPPDLIFLVALPFRLFGRRFVFDHHDINPELYEAKFGRRGLVWRLMRLCEWLTFRSADMVISTNESYRRIALERGGKRPDEVVVVRSGPDLARFRPVAPDPAWRRGRAFLVGYLGVMGAQEGLELLLDGVGHLVHRKGRTDIQFVLVGGGPSLEALVTLSARLGIADYVTFTGRVPDETLLSALSTADVCVNPDRVNPMNDKSTMNKILEYMALGKPIVQFAVTEGRVSAGEASLYARPDDPIDFADKIVELLADPERRTRMGAVGRQRVENELSWRHQAPRLVGAYARRAPHKPAASSRPPAGDRSVETSPL